MPNRHPSTTLITFLSPEFVHQDDRGCLKQLVSQGWNQVNVITSDPDTFRGGHYHQHNREMFYIIEGGFDLTLEKDGHKEAYTISSGDMFIIEPQVMHSFQFTQKTTLVALYDLGVTKVTETIDIHVR